MRSTRLTGLVATGFLTLTGYATGWAQTSPTLSVALAAEQARVGDLVEATLTLEIPEGQRFEDPLFPNWQRHWGSAELREIGNVERVDSEGASIARFEQSLTVASFRPGPLVLPSVTVTLRHAAGSESAEPIEVTSQPTTYEVVSVLPEGDREGLEPKPPAPPEALPAGSRFWWAAALGTALALALLGLLLARRRSEQPRSKKPLDPWLALEEALARLAKTADPEAVFTGLSLELRRYLGRSLAFPAAESTTTELKRRLLRSGLPPSLCSDVVALLTEADSVKFAKRVPEPGRLGVCLDEAREAADTVRRHLAPPEPSPSASDEERAA